MNWIITSAELARELAQAPSKGTGGIKLVDVREPEENAESRIEPSTLIPLGEIQARAGELNPNDDIVLYCAHGVRSLHALRALQMLGFKRLRSLDGGICAWDEFNSAQR
jgi:adenylyltransferase/sulfurtransferase